MKRRERPVLLIVLGMLVAGSRAAGAVRQDTDIEVVALTAVRNGVPARLCPGRVNSLRVSLVAHGTRPAQPVPLRLVLTIPGGSPAGTLVAEGSVALGAEGVVTTFTFLHVDVPARLRGRGARLVARANADGSIAETSFSNNEREIRVDAATDWECK